ncbi:sigma-70 family RNA polymerase sigma factor [Psychromonas sp. SP041]|uniref:sigma-70 family RNA polymerase sigma factor n=1 Tax=Psychromonas sp. SP041 TaxID=1365007 RepID=UPI0004016848|nr:sigma-70 family RNA polymerase sigma factor [Psychromonas sp. SP041]
MTEIVDESLMLQYAQGDIQAFTDLYTRHKDSLYRYFLRQSATPELAEELYQNVWSKLIKARSTYQVSSKFTTWLYRIAHNELIDHYRRNTTENKVIALNVEDKRTEATNEAEVGHLADQQQKTIDEQLHLSQQASHLRWCLKQLPRQQKEAFLLKHESGFTLNEIAKLVGESSEGVKSRIRYGINKLKHCLMHKMGRV